MGVCERKYPNIRDIENGIGNKKESEYINFFKKILESNDNEFVEIRDKYIDKVNNVEQYNNASFNIKSKNNRMKKTHVKPTIHFLIPDIDENLMEYEYGKNSEQKML